MRKNKKEIVEWGKNPKEGMVLVGFSCKAVLEGVELKKEVIELLRQKEDGYRRAVILVKNETFASFDDSKKIVDKIKKDLGYDKNIYKVYQEKYSYNINHVFWTYEEDIPKDPRYSKLNVVDLKSINMNNYVNEDKSFDSEKFIRENIPQIKLKEKLKQAIVYKEDAPPNKTESLDNEWNTNR